MQGQSNPQAVYEKICGVRGHRNDIAPMFVRAVREAYFKGIAVRNCFLCKYHGASDGDAAVFYKVKKEAVGSNEAVDCSVYKPLKTMDAYEEIDAVNREYQRNQLTKRFVGGWRV